MKTELIRSLTFQDGRAEEAMNFYLKLFDNSAILKLDRCENEMPDLAGKIKQARFSLDGNLFMCSDSPAVHDWHFSPAISQFIDCENHEELDRLFRALSHEGTVTMPPANYGFSELFAWVIDPFGISWQLNLN